MVDEKIDAKKFWSGIFDVTAYFKTASDIIRFIVMVAICFGIYFVGVWIHGKVTPKKQPPHVFNVTGQQGGCVKNSADQKEQKFGLLNF